MTQFRRLIEMGEDELACSLIAAMQDEMPPAGSLARAGAAVGLPAALIAAPASLLAAPGAISGLVVSGVGAGLAAGAGLGTPASAAVAGAAAPVAAGAAAPVLAASALPGVLPATLGALFKPFLLGLLGGAFALGSVQLAFKAAPRPVVESRAAEAVSHASAPRGVAQSAIGQKLVDGSREIRQLAADERAGDSGASAQANARSARASQRAAADDSDQADLVSGSRLKPGSSREKESKSLPAGDSSGQLEALAVTPGVTGALPDVPPEPSAAPEAAKKPGPSALVAEIALIDQARTALLTGKPERVLTVLAQYRGTAFIPEAEKLRAQAQEQLRKRKMAETLAAP